MPRKRPVIKLSAIGLQEISEYDVAVKPSTIDGAGLGLFATRDYKKGERIVPYTGELVPTDDDADNSKAKYLLRLSGKWSIDATNPRDSGVGRYANRGDADHPNNAKFSVSSRTGSIKANKKIKSGQEILVAYGSSYRIAKQ